MTEVKTVTSSSSRTQNSLDSKQRRVRSKKKRNNAPTLRKAPQAPKRFKSSYILFFTRMQQEIKDQLGTEVTISDISKRSSEMWRNLSSGERSYWDNEAAKDKQRYMLEKSKYTGPWQVPWKRAKKDPSAPKRPMSAFLYFSQYRRRIIKAKNPGMHNTEVSRVLGNMWKNAPDEERNPHIEREAREREKYKVQIANWRRKEDDSKKQRKLVAPLPAGGGYSNPYQHGDYNGFNEDALTATDTATANNDDNNHQNQGELKLNKFISHDPPLLHPHGNPGVVVDHWKEQNGTISTMYSAQSSHHYHCPKTFPSYNNYYHDNNHTSFSPSYNYQANSSYHHHYYDNGTYHHHQPPPHQGYSYHHQQLRGVMHDNYWVNLQSPPHQEQGYHGNNKQNSYEYRSPDDQNNNLSH